MEKHHIKLSETDKHTLEGILSKGSLSAIKYKRATALLELDRGKTFSSLIILLNISYPTLLSWRDKYLSAGLAFLNDKARPGRPAVIDGLQRAKITALACSDAPEGHSQWSLRLLADKIVELEYCEHISHSEVGLILKKTRLNLT